MSDESSTNAVLDEEAVVTSGDSLTPPETTTAKEGDKPGETPPTPGKSSQNPPSADAEDKEPPKGKDVPYGQYARIKEDRDKLRTVRDELSELGIKSKEDAELLLKDAEQAEVEAVNKGVKQLTDFILEDPGRFNADLWKKYPDYAKEYDGLVVSRYLENYSSAIEKSDPDLAAKLTEHVASLRNGHGSRAPKDPDKDAARTELLSAREEKQQVFEEQASSEISTAFRSKLDDLTKGLSFNSDKQRTRFYGSLFDAANRALERNPVFTRQRDRLQDVRNLSREQLRERREEVVSWHTKYATDPTLLKKLIDEEKELMGLRIAEKLPNGEPRKEVNGSGAPPSGVVTQDDKDRIYSELEKKFQGPRLSTEYAKALSKAKLGA